MEEYHFRYQDLLSDNYINTCNSIHIENAKKELDQLHYYYTRANTFF